MKRKTIDVILAKLGIKPFPDSDPRYSEPLSITFSSQVARPTSPLPLPPGPQSSNPRPTPEQIEANRQYNLARLAKFDQKAATARLKHLAEANLEAARARHLRDEKPEPE